MHCRLGGNMVSISLISSEKEFSETISSIVIKKGLRSRPLVITGYICVNMGSTLTHSSTGSFTSAIFGQTEKYRNDDLYQLFGRVSGRIKHWSTYSKTNVYCSTHFKTIISGMEECAKNVALNHNGGSITREDYLKPVGDTLEKKGKKVSEYGITEPFDSLEKIKSYLHSHQKAEGKLKLRNFPLRNNNTAIRYRGEDRLLLTYTTAEEFGNEDVKWGIDKKGGKFACSTMPCKHENQIKWVGIYLKSEYSFGDLERGEETKQEVPYTRSESKFESFDKIIKL